MTLGKITSIVTTLLNAGIDSTASSLLFALTDLALHQEKQQKLLASKNHRANILLIMCMGRRTFPVTKGPARFMEWDTVIGGYTIPRKTCVSLDMAAMVKDERFFPKAKEYIPERWLRNVNDEITKGQEFPFACKPFGFGPRGCIGKDLLKWKCKLELQRLFRTLKFQCHLEYQRLKQFTVH
ncbi:CYP12 [Mytilus coruscus]|uniref:Cholesterol side-chain cleavage enzyme, mitochondrial n=1 Tax=Mytilus coruscus TaxID=42192 RepID=A0A6J8AX79_MYTCO|nr:CYP12 [Mytilus coruscus]